MPKKSCNVCSRDTYRVKSYWSEEKVQYICSLCNISEEKCECPLPIEDVHPYFLSGFVPPELTHDDEPPKE